MTRPQIIRADTLDLQDKSSPTAQDHSLQPEHPAPLGIGPAAPHQQAAIRQVEVERNSEELRLQDAWSNAGSALREDPGSDDERTIVNNNLKQQDEQAIRLNGGISGDGEDADMQDADDDDDMDDDMMDKISSSPSIDDGRYSSLLQTPPWPKRRESLTPRSSPIPPAFHSSSPFTTTPLHFPISLEGPRRPCSVLAPHTEIDSPSPSPSSHIPFSYQFTCETESPSMEHHHGEYTWTRTTEASNIDENDTDDDSILDQQMSPTSRHMTVIERRLRILREDSQGSLMSDLDEELKIDLLKPVCMPRRDSMDDPFVETNAKDPRKTNGTSPLIPHDPNEDGDTEDNDSWTTDSDADSWNADLDDDDDASNDVIFSDDPRFVDSGWGGECLRETEDIDFEFVYALHTFVATVEGQANATKGDTMVLLDDSNSYWWLVRVVKDSSIGYLPAEHIETPTERLARLNKHRNIDLSATMLGDTAEKSKNPLKKAIRRRNAKTVQFAPPTYVEASDYDYSSDEGDGELFGGPAPKQVQQQQQQQQQDQQATQKTDSGTEDGMKVQPLKVNGAKKDSKGKTESETRDSSEDARKSEEAQQRASEEALDRPMDPKVTRNGTLRNTDSFFKDENTETRKITLTPNLLRDDSSTSTTGSRERGPSLESLEKNGFADKVKDDKKKKEKKSGMLSGLFKRKDKKTKQDSMDSDAEKQSEEIDRNSPSSRSLDETVERPSGEQAAPGPQRTSSKGKLQKAQRSRDDSPQKTKGILKTDSPTEPASDLVDDKRPEQQAATTMRLVPSDQDSDQTLERTASNEQPNKEQTKMVKPEKVVQAKQRMQLDDFDSDDESDPFADPDAQPKSAHPENNESSGRLSESPVHVSAADIQPLAKISTRESDKDLDAHKPPGLTQDNSSQETSSPVSTPTPEDSPMKTIPEDSTVSTFQGHRSASPSHHQQSSTASATIPPPTRPAPVPEKAERDLHISPPDSSESTQLPAWSDAALRAYLDDGSDVRDMLLVINDTTGVAPVGRDHPIMSTLFVEDSKALNSMSSELDKLLSGLMDKRMKRAGSAASKSSTKSTAARSVGSMR